MMASLYLYPQTSDHLQQIPEQLITCLEQLKLIGQSLDHKAWYIGDDFMRHIVFMGCSPYLKIAPESAKDQDFCHIQLQFYPSARLLMGENTRPPCCPHCHKPNPKILQSYQNQAIIIEQEECQFCQASAPLKTYAWKQKAGISRLFIKIPHIFPQEAIPSELLLKTLKKSTQLDWDYFYLHH